MENKHELTEKLKVVELEINNLKSDLRSISYKLEIANKYEDDLNIRMHEAKVKTAALRIEFFEMSSKISEKFNVMKSIFNVFTGNFFKN
jgi:predicted  nucleic acid-binding Zn-ribbon protein